MNNLNNTSNFSSSSLCWLFKFTSPFNVALISLLPANSSPSAPPRRSAQTLDNTHRHTHTHTHRHTHTHTHVQSVRAAAAEELHLQSVAQGKELRGSERGWSWCVGGGGWWWWISSQLHSLSLSLPCNTSASSPPPLEWIYREGRQRQVHFSTNWVSQDMPHPIGPNWCESLWCLPWVLQQRSVCRDNDINLVHVAGHSGPPPQPPDSDANLQTESGEGEGGRTPVANWWAFCDCFWMGSENKKWTHPGCCLWMTHAAGVGRWILKKSMKTDVWIVKPRTRSRLQRGLDTGFTAKLQETSGQNVILHLWRGSISRQLQSVAKFPKWQQI